MGTHDLDSYVDDVLGHTGDWERHKQMLRNFVERLKGANLSLKPSKCKIRCDKVNFLGHTLQKNSVEPQVETVGQILNTKRSKTKKERRSLLGMINFYPRYIPNCAEIIAPITKLTKNRAPNNVEWGDRQEKAFSEIKRLLSNEPILKLPDLNQEFILQTDASYKSLRGSDVSCRCMKGLSTMCCIPAKNLIPREQNYCG